jgi:endonuclease G, mitochondrial
MPSTAIIHAAVFTVGAVIGAGAAATITHRRQQHLVPPPATPALKLQKTGAVTFQGVLGDDVLKYGNPGE